MKSSRASSRRDSLLARCRTLAWALSRPFRGSSSGATMVEYLIVTGFIALFAIGAAARYGTALNKSEKVEAKLIEGEGLPSAGDLLSGLGDVTPPFCGINDRNNPFCVGGNCFAKGTPVAAEGGDRPIESIRLGDRVWARDVETGLVALQPVTKLFVRPDVATINMEVSAGSHSEHLTVTPGHRFWVEGQGWIPAQDLERSPLASLQESLLAIPVSGVPPPEQGQLGTTRLASGASESLWATPLSSGTTTTTVYNLEVDGFHSYFVGHLHALVHNQNGFPSPLNCPLPPSGTGGTSSQGTGGTSSQGTGGSAGSGSSPPVDGLTPCYKGSSTSIPQNSLPPNIQHRIQTAANNRKGPPPLSPYEKGQESEDAGDAAAEGYTDNNFPGWTCKPGSGSRVFDRVCWNGTGDVVIVEAKGGSGRLTTRKDVTQTNTVRQGTPQYVEAVLDDLRVSDPTLYNIIKPAWDKNDVRYVKVTQKFDAQGDPLPADVREFELDPAQRTQANCQK
jgi:Flp pilus assembly pilin Flp